MPEKFGETARRCTTVLHRVLSKEIRTPAELENAWPIEAKQYRLLDEVMDDVYEYWLLEPKVRFSEILETTIKVLENASDNCEETAKRLEEAIDSCE